LKTNTGRYSPQRPDFKNAMHHRVNVQEYNIPNTHIFLGFMGFIASKVFGFFAVVAGFVHIGLVAEILTILNLSIGIAAGSIGFILGFMKLRDRIKYGRQSLKSAAGSEEED
jgi:hypothetical protein